MIVRIDQYKNSRSQKANKMNLQDKTAADRCVTGGSQVLVVRTRESGAVMRAVQRAKERSW